MLAKHEMLFKFFCACVALGRAGRVRYAASMELRLPSGVLVRVTRKAVRNLRCRVSPPGGDVRVTVPWHATREQVLAFVNAHAAWIARARARVLEREAQAGRSGYARALRELDGVSDGMRVSLWGREYTLRLAYCPWRLPLAACVRCEGKVLVLSCPEGAQPHTLWRAWRSRELLRVAGALLPRWRERLGLGLVRLFVRPMRSRYGSCTPAAGRVRLSLGLSAVPVECLEYVLVHELVHMFEVRHNARFYALLDAHLPAWRSLRGRLLAS